MESNNLFYDKHGGHGLPLAAHEHRARLERLNASDPCELRAVAGEALAKRDALEDTIKQLNGVLNSAMAKLELYEAGQDATPRDEAVMPTPGQLWHNLLGAREDVRLAMLLRLLENTNTATDCFMQDHAGALTQLESDRELLSIAVFDMPTGDSTRQLHTAVRALRQIMVDGIARRVTVVELTDEEEPDDFPVEPDVKAKIGEQLKTAGIDLQSVCGFEWETEQTCADNADGRHLCSEVNPLHAQAHNCGGHCRQLLTHEQAEKLAEAGR
jgi:hypothetical protein